MEKVKSVARMFDGQEAKLFDALESKYGERPLFDVSTVNYDFSEHKEYAWIVPEVSVRASQCASADRFCALPVQPTVGRQRRRRVLPFSGDLFCLL